MTTKMKLLQTVIVKRTNYNVCLSRELRVFVFPLNLVVMEFVTVLMVLMNKTVIHVIEELS